jgi:hypothetical protein
MDWVQLIGHIAWPGTILVIVLIFRKSIIKKMGELIEVWIGRMGAKFKESQEGETKTILPTSPQTTSVAIETKPLAELSREARKILTTLWRRQTHHFQEDFSRRWSFRILPNSRVYGIFIIGFGELLDLGLIDWEPKDGQALLTDKGIEYIQKHTEIQESDDFYRFGDSS